MTAHSGRTGSSRSALPIQRFGSRLLLPAAARSCPLFLPSNPQNFQVKPPGSVDVLVGVAQPREMEVIPMAEVGLVRFAHVAHEVAEAVLPRYRRGTAASARSICLPTQRCWPFSACLCLMRSEDWTFREAEVRLGEHQERRAALGLERAPDYTTL